MRKPSIYVMTALAIGTGCSQPRTITGDIGPSVLVAVYDLDAPAAGVEAIFVVHAPVNGNTRDTVETSDGRIFQCRPLHRRGQTSCGGFDLRTTNTGILGTYRYCHVRYVLVTRTVVDATTGQSYKESELEPRRECSSVPVVVTVRGAAREVGDIDGFQAHGRRAARGRVAETDVVYRHSWHETTNGQGG